MEDKQPQKQKEIAKLEKAQGKQSGKWYFVIFLIVVTLIYAVDEITSGINNTIKTDVIKYLYDIVGSDVNSPEFNNASGNFFLLSMLLYVTILLAPFYKSLADKWGRKIFLCVNTILMAIGMLVCMIAGNLLVYLIGSAIMIFAIPNDFHVLYIMEVAPEKHRNKIASITKGLGLLSVSLIGVLRLVFMPDGSDPEAWRKIYLIPVIVAVAIGVFSFFAMNETPTFINKRLDYLKTGNQIEEDKKSNVGKAQGGVGNAIKFIFKNKQLRWIFIACLLYAFGCGATNYYESVFQMMGSQEAISVAIICFPIANAIITSVSGFISDKFGRKKSVVAIGSVSIVTLIAYVVAAKCNLGGIAVGIIYGIFLGCLYSASDILFLVLPAESTPTNLRASVVGTMSFMLFVGTAVSWGVIIVAQMLINDWGIASLMTIPFLVVAIVITAFKVRETNGVDLDSIQTE